jgi:ATP adenylyltransferase
VTMLFPKGRFWTQVLARAARAQVCGALQQIETESMVVEDGGLPFVLRVAVNLERKKSERALNDPSVRSNPFLPYDPDLFVCDVTPSHVCLFNKFNVVDHHLLIVTRQFEHQEDMLTFSDFEAIWTCLSEIEGLAFYNSGPPAGASQAHKHLQLVPFPLGPGSEAFPFAASFDATEISEHGRLGRLPFRHAIALLPESTENDPMVLAEQSQAVYGLLLDASGLAAVANNQVLRASGAYNILLTRDWMMIVPRARESFGPVSVNALGFIGSLFVRNSAEQALILAQGPLAVLTEVGQRGLSRS